MGLMDMESIIAEMRRRREECEDMASELVSRHWDEMAEREARAEIDRVLSAFKQDFDEIMDVHVQRVIALRWPDGNPYRRPDGVR